MAISAANAPDESRDAAPAAIRILTLRIGFVLLSGEADEASHQKLTAGRCHQILKRPLTLIFPVDILRRFFRTRPMRRAPIPTAVLTQAGPSAGPGGPRAPTSDCVCENLDGRDKPAA